MNIKCENISISLGGTEILKNISTDALGDINHKFIGIIGPNGSGKSTLLKCIYRVLKPDSGQIYIEDRILNNFSYKDSAKKIAVVSQQNYYNFDFTVEEVVLMGRSPHKKYMENDKKEDYEIVRQCLEKVDMENFWKRIFSTLSGGEQQRIILARALAQQTPCLLLDEPTNHLDIKYQFQLLDTVKSLDVTVIAALHDLNLSAMYCDYIYVLKDGEIKGHGIPKDILTKEFLKEIYEIDCQIVEDKEDGIIRVLFKPSFEKHNIHKCTASD